MKKQSVKTLARVERCSIEDTALDSCLEKNINLPTGKLYIIYETIKINMLLNIVYLCLIACLFLLSNRFI